jgi:predicted HTH domain antitoxin
MGITLNTSWELRQLSKLVQHQPQMVESALNKLLAEDDELRWALVVGAYLDEEINLGKAAELLGMPEIALRQRFQALGLPLRLGAANADEAQAEVGSARQHRV